jgi:hypothetical protein
MAQHTRAFREGLRRELPRWREEGLVSPDAAAALHARYRLGERESGGPTLLPVYVLGALLVGAGVVSLVAWNWDAMSPAVKLAVIGAAMASCHVAGWVLWKGTGRAPRLGHAIALVGTLVFGANVGLVAQIFHVSGKWWGGFAAFAAGAFAAGILYESLPHHLLAAALGLGLAGPGFAHDHPAAGIAAGYVLAAVLVAIAWRARSRALVVVTALGLGATLLAALVDRHTLGGLYVVAACLAAALAAAPLAAAPLASKDDTGARLGGAARVLGRVLFHGVAYVLSFAELADDAAKVHFARTPFTALELAAALPALLLAAVAIAAGLRRAEVDPLARGEALLIGATAIAFALGLSLRTGTGAALVANLALVFLALGRITRGLTFLARAPFWEGIALGGLLVVSRFLEIDTELWLKGAAFIACGVAVLAAGVLFERRRVRATEVPHVA